MPIVLVAISIAVAAGVYLTLSRDGFRMVVGLSLLGAAVNVVVVAAGRFVATTPPLLHGGTDVADAAASDPVVQALVLTAIVISFALLCFALVLGARLQAVAGTADTQRLRTSEPEPDDPVRPPELEP